MCRSERGERGRKKIKKNLFSFIIILLDLRNNRVRECDLAHLDSAIRQNQGMYKSERGEEKNQKHNFLFLLLFYWVRVASELDGARLSHIGGLLSPSSNILEGLQYLDLQERP